MAKEKPAILHLTLPFIEDFVPKLLTEQFLSPVTEFYNPAALDMDYSSLLEKCEEEYENIKVHVYIDYFMI